MSDAKPLFPPANQFESETLHSDVRSGLCAGPSCAMKENDATIRLLPYSAEHEAEWNVAVGSSKNGTFLFDRRFMDYHSDRFCDCSLMFLRRGKLIAVFPANFDSASACVYSHQGLTYGGLVLQPDCTTTQIIVMLDAACAYYRSELGATRLVVRPVPYIYHTYPADEMVYALTLRGAQLDARGIAQVLPLDHALPMQQLRRRHINRARSEGVDIRREATAAELHDFWTMLDSCLHERHGVGPVHSEGEIAMLMERFPHNIHLVTAYTAAGQIAAGAWVFTSGRVAHMQYLATTADGRRIGALDLAVATIIHDLQSDSSSGIRCLDFGTSTEQGGRLLNEGLTFQKEGFGARGVCYDSYSLQL